MFSLLLLINYESYSETAKLHTSKKVGRPALVPSLEDTPSSFDIRKHPMKLISTFLVEDEILGVGKIIGYNKNKWRVMYRGQSKIEQEHNATEILERLTNFQLTYGRF